MPLLDRFVFEGKVASGAATHTDDVLLQVEDRAGLRTLFYQQPGSPGRADVKSHSRPVGDVGLAVLVATAESLGEQRVGTTGVRFVEMPEPTGGNGENGGGRGVHHSDIGEGIGIDVHSKNS